jgi:hypothetical protein
MSEFPQLNLDFCLYTKVMYESSSGEEDDGGVKSSKKGKSSGMVDLEDLGPTIRKMKKAKEIENGSLTNGIGKFP